MAKPDFFNAAVQFAWLLRADVRARIFAVVNDPGEAAREFLMWWLVFGRREYPAHRGVTPGMIGVAGETVCISKGMPVTRLMRYLRQVRSDACDGLSPAADGWAGFARWYYLFGVPEHELFDVLPPEELAWVESPSPEVMQDASQPISRLAHWLWLSRDDVRQACGLESPEGRERLLAWFYVFGLKDNRLFRYLSLETAAGLSKRISLPGIDGLPPVTRLMWYHFVADAEIAASIDLHDAAGRERLRRICDERLRSMDHLGPLWNQLNCRRDLPEGDWHKPGRMRPRVSILGVNLVGFAMGEFGVGEDVRMMARALTVAGIDFCVLNRQAGTGIRHMDFSLVEHLSSEPRYPITVICMPAFDTAAFWLDRPDVFRDTHVIGFWPWELPEWPEEWHGVYDLVDEVWCSSRYTSSAFSKQHRVPVFTVPMAVALPKPAARSRADFGLPEGRYLFLVMFDYMSYPSRKNPTASIEAFRAAFPRGDEAVNLVVKVSNVVKDEAAWKKIETACQKDARILLMCETMDRETAVALIAACDAYVSLHRAEGFGRIIAEAMVLQKPVIATDFSGSQDFVTESTGYPVKCAMVEVGAEEYPWSAGQVWAEPDHDAAVRVLREVYADPARAEAKGRAANRFICDTYSPEIVASVVRSRFEAVGVPIGGESAQPHDGHGHAICLRADNR